MQTDFNAIAAEAAKTVAADGQEPTMVVPTTARGWLDALDKFLSEKTVSRYWSSNVNYSEQAMLWNVLAALRGPDQDNGYHLSNQGEENA